MNKLIVIIIGATISGFVLLAINPCVIIDSTERGLMFNWGAIQPEAMGQGIHWRTPIAQHVEKVTILPIQLDHKVQVNSDGAITKDNQTIGADLTVFYKYKEAELVKMWKDYGISNIENIITQTLRESFKAVIGQYDIFKLPLVQDEIRGNTWNELQKKLSGYPIEVTELKVVNYDWSDAFDTQIQQTMERAQQVKQKEQELLIAEQEAQKQVKKAEAEKTSTITIAEGAKEAARLNAEAKALEGEGIRKYNESVATNWEIELKKMQLNIELQRVEKWNGQYVPVNNYGPIPVQTGSILGDAKY